MKKNNICPVCGGYGDLMIEYKFKKNIFLVCEECEEEETPEGVKEIIEMNYKKNGKLKKWK